jgi:uncharacterized protein YaiI (UPF0178 family)
MSKEYTLTGGAQEWLRRIALNRPLAIVPDAVAVVLIDIGFAQRSSDGSLAVTDSGGAYLDSRGIARVAAFRKSAFSMRRKGEESSAHASR